MDITKMCECIEFYEEKDSQCVESKIFIFCVLNLHK